MLCSMSDLAAAGVRLSKATTSFAAAEPELTGGRWSSHMRSARKLVTSLRAAVKFSSAGRAGARGKAGSLKAQNRLPAKPLALEHSSICSVEKCSEEAGSSATTVGLSRPHQSADSEHISQLETFFGSNIQSSARAARSYQSLSGVIAWGRVRGSVGCAATAAAHSSAHCKSRGRLLWRGMRCATTRRSNRRPLRAPSLKT